MSYPQQYNSLGTPAEAPLWAPLYGASPKQAIQRFFKKYATFSGRASRSEYWWVALLCGVIAFVFYGISIFGAVATAQPSSTGDGTEPGPGVFAGLLPLLLWGLAVLVPSLALGARRLHDANMSAWLLLLGLVPYLGAIALTIIYILPSVPQGQRFDENPTPGNYPGAGFAAPGYPGNQPGNYGQQGYGQQDSGQFNYGQQPGYGQNPGYPGNQPGYSQPNNDRDNYGQPNN